MSKLYSFEGEYVKEIHVFFPNNITGIVIDFYGNKVWYVDGKYHRLDGHAIEYSDGSKEWFIDNKRYTKKQHDIIVPFLKDIMKLKGLV